jgi:WD40 repeat protein
MLVLTSLAAHANAGDKSAARLADLQARVARRDFAEDKLRRELLAFAREHVGTPQYAKAMDALRFVPGPFDRLDATAISADDRKALGLRDLVAFERPNNRAVASVAISFDGERLAVSGWDNVVRVYQLGAREPKSAAKIDASPSGVAFSADGKWLATGCADTRAIIWDIAADKPKPAYELSGHRNRPFAVAFGPKGKVFASACFDPVVRLWKLEDLTPEVLSLINKEKNPSFGIASLAFSHDGKYLVAGSMVGNQTLRIWDTSGTTLVDRAPGVKARTVVCSPTEPIIAFAADDGVIQLRDIGKMPSEKILTIDAHTGGRLPPIIKSLAFAPDGKSLASGGQDRRVCIWNVDGSKQREWQLAEEPRALAFSSDGRHLVVGNSDGTLFIFRLAAAK